MWGRGGGKETGRKRGSGKDKKIEHKGPPVFHITKTAHFNYHTNLVMQSLKDNLFCSF